MFYSETYKKMKVADKLGAVTAAKNRTKMAKQLVESKRKKRLNNGQVWNAFLV